MTDQTKNSNKDTSIGFLEDQFIEAVRKYDKKYGGRGMEEVLIEALTKAFEKLDAENPLDSKREL